MQLDTKKINTILYLYITKLSNNLAELGIPKGSPAEKLIVKAVMDTLNEMLAEYGGK